MCALAPLETHVLFVLKSIKIEFTVCYSYLAIEYWEIDAIRPNWGIRKVCQTPEKVVEQEEEE